MRSNIALMKLCYEFLDTLTDAQLKALIGGKIGLAVGVPQDGTIVPKSSKLADAVRPGLDIVQICAHLDTLSSTEDARSYMAGLKAKKAELVAIAKHLSAHVTSKDNMGTITDRIIENAVGHKLRSRAIFATKL